MELAVATNLFSVPRLYPRGHLGRCCGAVLVGLKTSIYRRSCNFRVVASKSRPNGDGDDLFVDVIGIGTRKDALLDFCMESPFLLSSPFRFWNVSMPTPETGQLEERSLEADVKLRVLEVPRFLQLRSKAVILVASAGYGSTHLTTIDLLKAMKSRNGFSAAIFLNSFSFEGQRRQSEVKDLKRKLREHTTLFIDIDTDSLLKKELVTLDEAVETANNAVVLAINAISILISETSQKVVRVVQNDTKELEVLGVVKILESCKEAKIGFGAGDNITVALWEALYDCPFLDACSENLNGILMLIIASSGSVEDRDVHASLKILRQTTRFTGDIVISRANEPKLESNVIVTIVVQSFHEAKAPEKSSFLSKLAQHAQHFPFIYNLISAYHQGSNNDKRNEDQKDVNPAKVTTSEDRNAIDLEYTSKTVDLGELHRVSSTDGNGKHYSSNYVDEAEESEFGITAAARNNDELAEAGVGFQREPLSSWNLGQEWTELSSGATAMLNDLSFFHLPVGVKTQEMLKDGTDFSNVSKFPVSTENNIKGQALVSPNNNSFGALTNARAVAAKNLHIKTFVFSKSRTSGMKKKQGDLSARAVSMLEAERDPTERWSPVMEMQYRGGVYRGRCQGGLPEGKGRLILEDGSIYDGMWHYGKRSGPGTLYLCNGDVFQGSWRDDLMHGKGWYYFHTGDRWFANFWKGRANGESRFYSKNGDVFFGHFQEGWRHGQFLCIHVDGARYIEIWSEGNLVSRKAEE